MRQDGGEMLNLSLLELLDRASTHNDLEAWVVFRQSLGETALTRFHLHPRSEAACRVQSDTHIVALAFEQLWQSVIQGQVDCETLTGVLVYLRACLNGVILGTLRVLKQPGVVSERMAVEPDLKSLPQSREVWDWLQVRLTGERERRLAYLLYHCGMESTEVVRCYPREWSDIHEVTRLRCVLVKRLMNESHH